MSRGTLKARLFATAAGGVLAMSLHAGAAQAQTPPIPPEHYTLDERGVDLISGQIYYPTTEVVIGPQDGGLAYGRMMGAGAGRNRMLGTINASGSIYSVSIGDISELFVKTGTVFVAQSNSGATLTQSGSSYTFTAADGTVGQFSTLYAVSTQPWQAGVATITSLRTPRGDQTDYHYKGVSYCRLPNPNGTCQQMGSATRLQSVTNNRGYQIKFLYQSNLTAPTIGRWLKLVGVVGLNNAVDYCGPVADTCTGLTRTWPQVSYGADTSGNETVTDEMGRVTTYGLSGNFSVRLPGATSDQTVATHTGGRVSAVTDPTGTWTYGYVTTGAVQTTTTSGPLGQALTVVADLTTGRVSSTTDALGRVWAYQYSAGVVTRVTAPEGNYTQFAYDGRGNTTQTTHVAKPGSGLANIVTSATYPASCANPVTCNLPITTTDAAGAVTNYTWDSTHGGPLTITAPAPTTGADRPQTRYTYAAQTAQYKNSSGVIAPASTSITLPVEVSACATGTACDGAANEVLTTIAYGSAGVANDLQPSSISQGSGASPSMAVTAVTYTANGDVETVDGPLAGSGDTTRYRYDDARQVVGVVGPDPDGGGAGLNRAQRLTYNPRGQVTLAETGVTPGYTDSDWAAFNPLVRGATVYDDRGRPVLASRQSGAGATISVQQVSYDAAGRPDCTAVRMNPATWGSLPPSACTATTAGSDGPDRISQTTYDAVGRRSSTTSALGQAEAVTESLTYTTNGQVASLTDGEGHVSIQEYDAFDRPVKLRYPNAGSSGTSTTDYEEAGYDAAGNVVSSRDRAGQITTVAYDALNRPTSVDAPAGTMDLAYTYDNLGRVLTSTGGGQTLTNAWDPLSRLTSETGPLGAMSYQYDAAGRRTRITWPDAFYAQYDHDLYGAVTAIRENGATSGAGVLATYAYNDLGQTTGITRGDGTTTGYGYDAAGRMTTLSHDMAGSANDVAFGYAWNPAGQIASRTVSNPAYVYAPATGSTAYANDGLNRVTSVGGAAVGYNWNQEITSALGNSYGYDAAGRLLSAAIGGGGYTFEYDPSGRLSSSYEGRFQYAGAQLTGEYDSAGALTARHVPGPGLDQPVASYSGGARIQQIADERGSVIGMAGAGGVTVNRYDEYGVPASGNAGRFQYTGQAVMAPGVYNYRARAYAPELGRFLQTDPIGYEAGANLYAYVGGDPVNRIDPMGLQDEAAELPGVTVVGRCRRGTHLTRRGTCEPNNRTLPATRPGGGNGTSGSTSGPAREERERFCRAYTAIRGAADAFNGAHEFARRGASVAQGRLIDLRALDVNIRLLELGGEATRVWGEIRDGRSWSAAFAGAGGRMAFDYAASRVGGALAGVVGLETGPGAIVLAGVGAVSLPLILDAAGVREAVGDLASGVSVGLTLEDCNG